MAEVQGGDMRRLLDTLATKYQGSVDDLLGAAERGETPTVTPPAPTVTPPPIAPEAPRAWVPPQIEVEPQPWQRPSWPTAAAPVSRAGADIHMRSATAHAVCGATEIPLASVADPTQVTCRACRLMISAPHISPCTTERWLRDTPAPEPEPIEVVDHQPTRRAWPVAAAVAGLGTLALAIVAIVALSGHAGPSSSASIGGAPSDVHTVGGGVAEPTPFSTPLPTVAPTEAPTPTPTPTQTPTPTPAPVSQNQTVTVVDGQVQQQNQAQQANAQSPSSTLNDPPGNACQNYGAQTTTITFQNNDSSTVDTYWISPDCSEVLYTTIPPGQHAVQTTYVGQKWRVRQASTGTLLAEAAATAAPQTVDVP